MSSQESIFVKKNILVRNKEEFITSLKIVSLFVGVNIGLLVLSVFLRRNPKVTDFTNLLIFEGAIALIVGPIFLSTFLKEIKKESSPKQQKMKIKVMTRENRDFKKKNAKFVGNVSIIVGILTLSLSILIESFF